MLIYLDIDFQEIDTTLTNEYKIALACAFTASIFGYISLEMTVRALRITKSGLASFGGTCGLIPTFAVDLTYFHRTMLPTDCAGFGLIVLMQMFLIYKSVSESTGDQSLMDEKT